MPTPLPELKLAALECNQMAELYGVQPGKSWGSLPPDKQQRWGQLRCGDASPTSRAAEALDQVLEQAVIDGDLSYLDWRGEAITW